MLSAIGVLGAVVGSALVLSGAMVRRAMRRGELAQVMIRMPAGAAQEGN
jgi:hypothetical protein